MRKLFRFILQVVGFVTLVGVTIGIVAMLLIGQWLQYSPPLEKADYLVPLAGDDNRLLTAIELYKQGYAPVLMLSNAIIQPPDRAERLEAELGRPRVPYAQRRREILEHLGVPAAATAEFGTNHVSTVEEAESLKKVIGDRDVKILLVTSPSHARRATIIFQSVMPKAHVSVAITPEHRLANPWWSEQESALLTMTEAMKMTYFWLGGAFRTRTQTQ